jgi:DNA-directed RNA polymerase subunit F
LISTFFCSCGDSNTEENTDELIFEDTVKAVTLNVGGELFSIPSPIQSASLVKNSGVPYNKQILSSGNKCSQYASDFTKALNLGVYGADLAYISIHNQAQDALSYLAATKTLADKLGVSSAFNQATISRIKNNISNKDSMLVLISLAYRASDEFLKTNKRTEMSSLILAGGWLESMNFSLKTYKQKPIKEIKFHIAEQKQALTSVIKLLTSHNLPEANDLLNDLDKLTQIYYNVITKYKYVEPTTDESIRTTYINSTTEVIINDEQLNQIAEIIFQIREKIINSRA